MSEPHTTLRIAPLVSDQSKLRKRVVSAFAMIAVALLAAWAGGWLFNILIISVLLLMTWEWSRMINAAPPPESLDAMDNRLVFVIGMAICVLAGLVFTYSTNPLGLLAPVIVAPAAVFVRRGGLVALGWALVALPALGLIWFRSSPEFGVTAVLTIFVVVWATDTFAMVTGKLVGGPHLFPTISPNKTWAGAIGGLVAGSLAGTSMIAASMPGDHWWYGLIVSGVLSLATQVGDLVESAVKRTCRVKDSSDLIPGHGGVLDRLDGLIGASIAAAIWAILVNAEQPARALLTGS